jgi:hypothetical protein
MFPLIVDACPIGAINITGKASTFIYEALFMHKAGTHKVLHIQ